jgi:DNA-binding XRE family transcriptional regulator
MQQAETRMVDTVDGRGPFGLLLRRHRVAAGLSQKELAEKAGLSRRGISDLERGEWRIPHPATAAAWPMLSASKAPIASGC